MELLLKNGCIVNATESRMADLRVVDAAIVEIGVNLMPLHPSVKIIDATDMFLFPGGIDPHVHMHLPTPAGYSADDFVSGSKAALLGGTTTLIDFVTPKHNQSLVEALQLRMQEAQGCYTDYSFHVSPVDWHPQIETELKACKEDFGITSFKVYMAYKKVIGLDDAILLKVMRTIAKLEGMVTVHAELGDDIEVLRNQLVSSGHTSPVSHCESRPASLETAAVEKAIQLAHQAKCPLYIVHLSADSSLKAVIKARSRGAQVWVETCPQYLLFNDNRYVGEFENTAAFVMSPPLRKKADQEALWQGLAVGSIQTVGTDHCPFTFQQKSKGRNDFRYIPNGAGGVEHRMTLLFSEGVIKNKITTNQFVQLTSTKAAQIFGLYPAKGLLAVGSDADIVVWNPKKQQTISVHTHHQNTNLNIYDGISTVGAPEIVIKGGKIVVEEDRIAKHCDRGKFLFRN